MVVSYQQAQQAQDDFDKESFFIDLFYNKKVINSSGISPLDRLFDSSFKLYSPLAKSFDVKDFKPGESLEDWCLRIGFRKTPTQDILSKLPDVYKGVRVFYEENGGIIAA